MSNQLVLRNLVLNWTSLEPDFLASIGSIKFIGSKNRKVGSMKLKFLVNLFFFAVIYLKKFDENSH